MSLEFLSSNATREWRQILKSAEHGVMFLDAASAELLHWTVGEADLFDGTLINIMELDGADVDEHVKEVKGGETALKAA